jgi:Phage integrase family
LIAVEIVRKNPDQVGFAVNPRRWVVERFFAWIGRNRRLRGHHRVCSRLPLRRIRHAARASDRSRFMTFENRLLGDGLRALRELKRQSASPFVFASERGGPLTPSGFAKLLARAGDEAKIGFKVHPHMLRHACGYALANKGIDTRTLQAYLGHRSINSTTRYAALAPGRFKNIWGRV